MLTENKKKETLLTDIQYFGTINWILNSFHYTNIEIEQYETYQKMSFRNRCVVLGGNGPVNLSVPLEKGRSQKALMKDVKICWRDNWPVQHWRTIESGYNRSPFFDYYRDGLWHLLSQKRGFLLDLNLDLLAWLQKILQIPAVISLTSQYRKPPVEGVTDRRNAELPKNYREGPFPIRYTQVFEDRIGFIPNVSILDLLFSCGPQTPNLLRDNKLTF